MSVTCGVCVLQISVLTEGVEGRTGSGGAGVCSDLQTKQTLAVNTTYLKRLVQIK